MPGDERTRKLYELPLDEFTPARNALASALQEERSTDEAAAVRKLAKPSIAAWAVNQLARSHPDEMEQLISLRERLGSATSAADMRVLSTQRHQLISDLTEKARGILEGSGHAASTQTLGKVSATLYGGTTDEELAALKAGTLSRELHAGGFEGVGDLDWSAGAAEEPSGKRAEKARREKEELEAELEEAENAAKSLAREARLARRAAEVATNDAEVAQARVERIRARLEK